MNTDTWPNELLNSYLMGKDEWGHPAKKPGFMLLATQNPVSFAGRHEIDPAIRQRLIKLKLDWPVYQSNVPTIGCALETPKANATTVILSDLKNQVSIEDLQRHSMFAGNQPPTAGAQQQRFLLNGLVLPITKCSTCNVNELQLL